ncbi:hypothetical protein ACHAXR_011762 [Thalassiosira sp. AJA248-18]
MASIGKKTSAVVIQYNTEMGEVLKDVMKVLFDSMVTEILEDAFRDCRNSREVVLNEGLQKIGKGAFRGCIMF